MNTETPSGKLFIGCPVWACAEWVGSLYRNADRKTWLGEYSKVFNTVEGNSVFYGLPSIETAVRWGESVQPGFRFSLKFPKEISHEKQLVNADESTARFLEVLATLDRFDCVGPSFLQLAPKFDGGRFDVLERYLRSLPAEFPFAVEVRHSDYFQSSSLENELDHLLTELGMDRCLFDSRALFSRKPADEIETESQRRKPRSPFRTTVTGQRPMLRLVGRNNLDEAIPWINEWVPIIADWLKSGLEPFVFTHSPNDAFAPAFARRLHDEIRRHTPLDELPGWPAVRSERQQMKLF